MTTARSASPFQGDTGLPEIGSQDQPFLRLRDTAQAMSQENIEIVRRALEASAAEEPRAVLPYLDPEVEIEDSDIPDADDYRGHGAYFDWLVRWVESWETSRMEDIEVLPGAEDGLVIALFRMVARGRGSGATSWPPNEGSASRSETKAR